jgi:hypothetical protein
MKRRAHEEQHAHLAQPRGHLDGSLDGAPVAGDPMAGRVDVGDIDDSPCADSAHAFSAASTSIPRRAAIAPLPKAISPPA